MEDKIRSYTGRGTVLDYENIKFKEGSWWQRRSNLEKKLVVLFVLVLLIAIIFLIVLIVLQSKSDQSRDKLQQTTPSIPKQPDICMTPSCVTTAARIVDRANFTAHPCVDFYEYACGSWMMKNGIDDDKVMNSIFTHLNDELSANLRKLLEASPKQGEANSVKKARDFYKSCLDTDQIELRGGRPLLNTLSEFGGWPVLNSTWDDTSYDINTMLTKLAVYGQHPLILNGIELNPHNTSQYMLSFDQPALGLPSRNYYLRGRNDSNLMAYQTYIGKVAVALGAEQEKAETAAREIVDLEIQLANLTVPPIERLDLTELYQLTTVKEMNQNYIGFDWTRYLQTLLSMDGIGIDINEDEVIINKAPKYFEKVFDLLSETIARKQANYQLWIFIKSRISRLDSKFEKILLDFAKVLLGSGSSTPRWKTCIQAVNTGLALTVGRMFVDTHFDETAKSTMVELISYLRDAFSELIEEADWMDDATRKVAREKSAVILEKIGYPDAIKNNTYIDDYYKEVIFNTSLYFENYNNLQRTGMKESLRLLRDDVDKTRWVKEPALVGAFYNPQWNEIIFPAGILQPPFYDESQPRSINFGSIGSFIGHEITHGFDTTGRQFDKDGSLRQWWANDVIKRFQDRVQCFINQTSSFEMPEAEMNVNGAITQGEDVADNGGMKESYRAYRKWVTKQGKEEPLLPGIPLNNNQLFYLAWAQVWCTRIRPETARYYILTDSHSPNRIRAFTPMRNMPEFAKAYNCPKGSPMNPVHKCSVW